MTAQSETPIRQYVKSLSGRELWRFGWRMLKPRLYLLAAIGFTATAATQIGESLLWFSIDILAASWALNKGIALTIGLANHLTKVTKQ